MNAPRSSEAPTHPQRRRWLQSTLLLSLALAGGCDFNVRKLGKSDIDMVIDEHIREQQRLMRELASKLYRRNPRELSKSGRQLDERVEQLLGDLSTYYYTELDRRVGNEALQLAFDSAYRGDRVFAFMVGVKTVLYAAYGLRSELFMFDELDHQALYNSARNLETINWRLNNLKDRNDVPYLLSNGVHNGVANLSFERLFGKMISIQDMMAKVVADKNDRAITSVVHNVASTALLPIGL